MKAVKPSLNLSRLSQLNAAGNAALAKQALRVHHSECYSVKQVRQSFTNIEALAASMAERQIQPCVCWPKDEKGYRIQVGERRLRAARHGDLYLDIVVDPILPQLTPVEAIFYQLVENTQREQLSPREEASAVMELFELGMNATSIAKARAHQEQISESTAQSWVSRMKKLATMPELVAIQHDAGLHDIETLNNLIDIYNLDRRVCETLIMDGSLSREATRKALKAIKAGDSVPTFTSITPSMANNITVAKPDVIGPQDLLSIQYIVGIEPQSFGYGGVIAVKFAEKELKLSWLTHKDLQSEYVFDVRTRIAFYLRDFLKKIERSVKPHEAGDYAKLCEYWTQDRAESAQQAQVEKPIVTATKDTEQVEPESPKKPEQVEPEALKKPEQEAIQQTASTSESADVAEEQKPVVSLASTQNTPKKIETTQVVIHGFVEGEPVELITDTILSGNRVMVMTSNGLEMEIPSEDFTLSHLSSKA